MPLDAETDALLKEQGKKMYALNEENEKLRLTISHLSSRIGRLEKAFKTANEKKRFWKSRAINGV
tara:strand:- start:718 stop:912 length:195 start_codon:yes stop_codon:yes gene_type:complete